MWLKSWGCISWSVLNYQSHIIMVVPFYFFIGALLTGTLRDEGERGEFPQPGSKPASLTIELQPTCQSS